MMVMQHRTFPRTVFVRRGSALSLMWPWLLLFTLIATAITVPYGLAGTEVLTLTSVPFTLVGLALSIFLGFRNTACYDRWWEARKLWGALVNTSRSFTRQVQTMLVAPPAEAAECAALQADLVRRFVAFVWCFESQLRETPLRPEVARYLPPGEGDAVGAFRNPCVAIARGMADGLRTAHARGWLHPECWRALDGSLTALSDLQGGCERIRSTPVPLSYTVLTHRIVLVYCGALPLGIVGDVGWLTPLVTLIVAFAFVGFDAVGTQIEEPFGIDPNDLPLTAISRMIEIDLLQQLGEADVPAMERPVDGILL